MIWYYSSKWYRYFFPVRLCNFLLSVIIKRMTWFLWFKLCFEIYVCLISSVLHGPYKILRAIDLLFHSNIQTMRSKLYFLPIIFAYERSTFLYFWGIFYNIFLWFCATFEAYWKHLSSLFLGLWSLFCFSTIFENLYMICLNWRSFYEVYEVLWFFLLIIFYIFVKVF